MPKPTSVVEGGRPTSANIAVELGFKPDDVEFLRHVPPEPISLATPVGEDGGTEFGDLIRDDASASPEESLHAAFQGELLSRCLERLPERSRRVLELRFGLNGLPAQSLAQVGLVIGLTAEGTRQVESAGLRMLRAFGESDHLRDVIDQH